MIKNKGTEEQIQRAREGGKGNSVNAIYNEIKNQDVEKKVCSKCKKEKPVTEFYKGRGICKDCHNKAREERKPVTDFRGNVVATAEEVKKYSTEDVEKIIEQAYDTDRVVERDINDLLEDIKANVVETVKSNLEWILRRKENDYTFELTENDKKAIKNLLGEIGDPIKTFMKGFDIYE